MDFTTQLTLLAAAASGSDEGIFAALGIDWKMLIVQAIAFLVLVWILGKFVYPKFVSIIDERQEKIDASVQAAEEAEQHAEAAQDEVAKLLKEARKEAKDIVQTAKNEATALIDSSDEKAKARADKIVADAREKLEKDVIAARKALHNDTLELVALATEKVLTGNVDAKLNRKVIERAIEEAR